MTGIGVTDDDKKHMEEFCTRIQKTAAIHYPSTRLRMTTQMALSQFSNVNNESVVLQDNNEDAIVRGMFAVIQGADRHVTQGLFEKLESVIGKYRRHYQQDKFTYPIIAAPGTAGSIGDNWAMQTVFYDTSVRNTEWQLQSIQGGGCNSKITHILQENVFAWKSPDIHRAPTLSSSPSPSPLPETTGADTRATPVLLAHATISVQEEQTFGSETTMDSVPSKTYRSAVLNHNRPSQVTDDSDAERKLDAAKRVRFEERTVVYNESKTVRPNRGSFKFTRRTVVVPYTNRSTGNVRHERFHRYYVCMFAIDPVNSWNWTIDWKEWQDILLTLLSPIVRTILLQQQQQKQQQQQQHHTLATPVDVTSSTIAVNEPTILASEVAVQTCERGLESLIPLVKQYMNNPREVELEGRLGQMRMTPQGRMRYDDGVAERDIRKIEQSLRNESYDAELDMNRDLDLDWQIRADHWYNDRYRASVSTHAPFALHEITRLSELDFVGPENIRDSDGCRFAYRVATKEEKRQRDLEEKTIDLGVPDKVLLKRELIFLTDGLKLRLQTTKNGKPYPTDQDFNGPIVGRFIVVCRQEGKTREAAVRNTSDCVWGFEFEVTPERALVPRVTPTEICGSLLKYASQCIACRPTNPSGIRWSLMKIDNTKTSDDINRRHTKSMYGNSEPRRDVKLSSSSSSSASSSSMTSLTSPNAARRANK